MGENSPNLVTLITNYLVMHEVVVKHGQPWSTSPTEASFDVRRKQ
jgi:hypothetical protein